MSACSRFGNNNVFDCEKFSTCAGALVRSHSGLVVWITSCRPDSVKVDHGRMVDFCSLSFMTCNVDHDGATGGF